MKCESWIINPLYESKKELGILENYTRFNGRSYFVDLAGRIDNNYDALIQDTITAFNDIEIINESPELIPFIPYSKASLDKAIEKYSHNNGNRGLLLAEDYFRNPKGFLKNVGIFMLADPKLINEVRSFKNFEKIYRHFGENICRYDPDQQIYVRFDSYPLTSVIDKPSLAKLEDIEFDRNILLIKDSKERFYKISENGMLRCGDMEYNIVDFLRSMETTKITKLSLLWTLIYSYNFM